MTIIEQIEQFFSLQQVQEYTLDVYNFERTSCYSGYAKSSQYCADALKRAGFQQVERIAHKADGVTTVMDCTMPQAWELTGRSTLEIVEGDVPEYSRMLADSAVNPVHAVVWSAPTPQGGVTCELVDYDSLDPEHPDCQGKWVLYNHVDGSNIHGARIRPLALAGAKGVAVSDLSTLEIDPDDLFWPNGQGAAGWYYTKDDPRLPIFSLSPRRAHKLAAELKRGKIVVHAEMNCRIYDGEVHTVTGIIPGESEEEYLLLAHLYEPFVGDDAIGFAACCEFGRQLVARGVKLKKTVRVILSMELYGFAAYLMEPAHRRKAIGAMNMDAFAITSTDCMTFRYSPVYCAIFTDWFYRDWFAKHLPQLKWQNQQGNLSDDTFISDPIINIPTNWFFSSCGIFHHNTGPHFLPDWPKIKTLLPVFYAALETILNCRIPDYSARAVKDFNAYARRTLAAAALTKYEKRVRLQAELMQMTQRLASAEKYGAPKASTAKLQAAFEAAMAKVDTLPMEDLTAAEYKALNIVVKRLGDGAYPFSLAKVPYAERFGQHGELSQNAWALCDGKRTLLECIRIDDGKMDDYEEGGADCPIRRSSRKEILAAIDFVKFAEKYGYCKILPAAPEMSAKEFEKAILALGVTKGMKLAVHSTFSALGEVTGGAEAICDVFQRVIGKDGLLLMPTFTFQLYSIGKFFGKPYDVLNTPSRVGILGETFRHLPGVYRSYDPCHPWAAWGKEAISFVEGHHLVTTISPKSPIGLLEQHDGWCMTISAAASVTFMHVVEYSYGARCTGMRTEEYDAILPDGQKVKLRTWSWREDTCERCPEHRTAEIYALLRKRHALRETMLGNAHITLFRLADYRKAYETLLKECCNKDSRAYPRTVATSVPSDWDEKRQCIKKNTTAYTGEFLK